MIMTANTTWRNMVEIGLVAEQQKDWIEANRIWKELAVHDMMTYVKTRKQEYFNCAVADVNRADWCLCELAMQEYQWALLKAMRRDT